MSKRSEALATRFEAETLAELRTNGDETARVIRSLEDDALDVQQSIPVFGPDPITTERSPASLGPAGTGCGQLAC